MTRNYKDYLNDILDAIDKAESFAKNMSYEDFCNDDKTIYSVTRALEIIGEAANKIPAEEQLNHPNLPWKEMIGMRNKLIHDYAGVDLSVLWKTLKNELPILKEQVLTIVKIN